MKTFDKDVMNKEAEEILWTETKKSLKVRFLRTFHPFQMKTLVRPVRQSLDNTKGFHTHASIFGITTMLSIPSNTTLFPPSVPL